MYLLLKYGTLHLEEPRLFPLDSPLTQPSSCYGPGLNVQQALRDRVRDNTGTETPEPENVEAESL